MPSPDLRVAGAAPRLYADLSDWWLLLSPPSHYGEEAADLLARLPRPAAGPRPTLLELGSGGGSLASHLGGDYQLTLTDLSPGMLAVNRRVNPGATHHLGDMRSLRLGRQFDVVLVHDAIMYATTPDDVRATLATAACHCRPGGAVMVVPDYVRETFAPGTEHGGEDGEDGRGLRYLEWTWDPDPGDHTYVADYAFLLRQADGEVQVVHDRHVEGLFSRSEWLGWFREAGLEAAASRDPWGRDVFLGRAGGG